MKKLIMAGAITMAICSTDAMAALVGEVASATGTTTISTPYLTNIQVVGIMDEADLFSETTVYAVDASTTNAAALLVWPDASNVSNDRPVAIKDNETMHNLDYQVKDITCGNGEVRLVSPTDVGLSLEYTSRLVAKCAFNEGQSGSMSMFIQNLGDWDAGVYKLTMHAQAWSD
ncbi:hypothetical protein R5P42_004801 [Escherichia coli]|nr:hypothetical protein [Escherichia coli]